MAISSLTFFSWLLRPVSSVSNLRCRYRELITSVLRAGNRHASLWSSGHIEADRFQTKEAFPRTEIIIRGDAGFAIPAIYEYCEEEKLGYVIGLIRNDNLDAND